MNAICADSGFLIGLYDERDEFHERATQYFSDLFANTLNQLVVPWPIVYETISTRMVRNRQRMIVLERDWKRLQAKQQLVLLDDRPFRAGVIDECFDETRKPPMHYRHLSAVDRVMRNILADMSIRIDFFVTFNVKGFSDVCKVTRRTILS
jgi:predicted nucleic acid-binding protein